MGRIKKKSKIRDRHNQNGSALDPVTYGGVGGDLKFWKTLRVEGSG